MSIRIPIGSATALFEDGATDFSPAPAEKIVRFADTPVSMITDADGAIRLRPTNAGSPQTRRPNRHYH